MKYICLQKKIESNRLKLLISKLNNNTIKFIGHFLSIYNIGNR